MKRRTTGSTNKGRDKTHYLYVAVLLAIALGIGFGLLFPSAATQLKPLSEGFIDLVKMMVAPIIFCTITLGVGSIAKASTVGKVGGITLVYFMVMSTMALVLGLVVGNLIHPGDGLNIGVSGSGGWPAAKSGQEFVLGIIPTSLLSSFVSPNPLQILFVALLSGFALQKLGHRGAPLLAAVRQLQSLVFRILSMIMWVAPLSAFGAIAALVGATGPGVLASLGLLMVAFYLACIAYLLCVVGVVLKLVTGINIFRVMKYFLREYLLVVSTASSEVALPRLIAKLEHLGVSKSVVGISVPTGYSFDQSGSAIYLTMGTLFIGSAIGKPLGIGEQISLLAFMIIASKGGAAVAGGGLATLAGGLQVSRPDLFGGIGIVVGIDRFMAEARALTGFTSTSVAPLVIGRWTGQLDVKQVEEVLSGRDPFDEQSMSVDQPMGKDEAKYVEEEQREENERLKKAIASVEGKK